jgi:hypothetical protein
MPTAGKGLLTVRRCELAPMVLRTIGHPEIAGQSPEGKVPHA